MTAINPAQLKIHCAEVCIHYNHPDKFVLHLHQLLEMYADRVRRPGLTAAPSSLPSYQVPAPVLRALERELKSSLESSPSQGLLLIDVLWEEEYLETRVLAAALLGQIPPNNPELILDRLQEWVTSPASDTIRCQVITAGFAQINATMPNRVQQFLADLLSKPTKRKYQAALCGIHHLVSSDSFQDLPFAFHLLALILEPSETGLVKEISMVLRSLIKRSEQETLYFLINLLAMSTNPRFTRIVRAVLPAFSPESQLHLKSSLRDS